MLLASASPPTFGSQQRWQTLAELTIRLATPMLGGGSVPGVPDLDQPFRPSSIRGALRRWWRASNSFSSADDVRGREGKLWGMVGENHESLVRIKVDSEPLVDADLLRLELNASQATAALKRANAAPAGIAPYYSVGLFSAEAQNLRAIPAERAFSLTIETRNISQQERNQVLAAVTSWLAYGGLGMRSRRGWGAVAIEAGSLYPQKNDGEILRMPALQFQQTMLPNLRRGLSPFPISGFTSLRGARVFTKPAEDRQSAWMQAVQCLGEFSKGLTPGSRRPFRGYDSHSPWPEVDAIRLEEGFDTFQSYEEDAEEDPIPIPRAELGLPRNFNSAPTASNNWRFQGKSIPAVKDKRLASPVLTSISTSAQGWHSQVVLLSRTGLKGARTEPSSFPTGFWEGDSRTGREIPRDQYLARFMPNEPFTDVLEIFSAYLQTCGWRLR